MKVLITLGPTQEPIDDVRYITNASSGKMGAALANEALERGYEVTLVHGPVTLQLPDCAQIPVRTAQEMHDAVMKELKDTDIFISTAAVADYAPVKTKGKIKSGQELSLKLRPTLKLVDEVRKKLPDLFIVGFKAEFGLRRDELMAKAMEFLKLKRLDMVVANDIEKDAFGEDETDVMVVSQKSHKEFGKKPKTELASYIWDEIELVRGEFLGF